MLKSTLSVFFAFTLATLCWFGVTAPVAAQTLTTGLITHTPSGGIFMFGGIFAGKRPTTLGVKDGTLAACPDTPNCVNSQSTNPQAKIEPLTYTSSPEKAFADLKTVIQNFERAEIITETDDYLHAEFTTALMGFVDDAEFYLNKEAGVIHVRSASRLGQSDLGVNRNRVELLRAKLQEQQS